MEKRDIVWARSLLALYRQAAVDTARDSAPAEARKKTLEELSRLHTLITAHEDLESLWRQGFGGSETGIKTALAGLVEASLACDPGSPIRALAEFAAEEIAFVFDGE